MVENETTEMDAIGVSDTNETVDATMNDTDGVTKSEGNEPKPTSKAKSTVSNANKKGRKNKSAKKVDETTNGEIGTRRTRPSTNNATETSKSNGIAKVDRKGKGKKVEGTDSVGKGKGRHKKMSKAQIKKIIASKVEPIKISDKYKILDGTLVWARMTGYPYFPAEVSSEKELPEHIEGTKPEDSKVELFPVQFFDQGTQGLRSWQWLPKDRLLLLGENRDIDEFLQSREAFAEPSKYLEKIKWGYNWAMNNVDEKTAYKE